MIIIKCITSTEKENTYTYTVKFLRYYNFSSIRHLVILENDYLFKNDYVDLFWEHKNGLP